MVAPDLPGHGFTTGASFDTLTLPRLREAIAALLQALKLPRPAVVAGHSAGAALALRWALDAPRPPHAVLGFAPSLVAPPAYYMQWMAPLVQPLATSAPVTSLLAWSVGPTGMIDWLLDSDRHPAAAGRAAAVPHAVREPDARARRDELHGRGRPAVAAAGLRRAALQAGLRPGPQRRLDPRAAAAQGARPPLPRGRRRDLARRPPAARGAAATRGRAADHADVVGRGEVSRDLNSGGCRAAPRAGVVR
ncbi:MAG: alpha/beta fold hydrolase [Comamonadaceae bacterium]|nr:alpha/beta fold hydrolase [Comamonadaceae bacterium]